MLSHNIFLMLTPCVKEMIGNLQCGFRRNRSTTILNSSDTVEGTSTRVIGQYINYL